MARLIDADDMIKSLMDMTFYDAEGQTIHDYEDRLAIVKSFVDSVPTVDAVPVRHGKWIYGNDFHWYTANCSKCGYQRRTDIKAKGWNEWRFCPNCGARMDGEMKEGEDEDS